MEFLTRFVKTGTWRLLLAAGLAIAAMGARAQSLENAVKATFLYKFALYVEWPATAFANAASPLSLCIAGDDPFGAALDGAVNGQRINGRDIAVRRIKTAGPETGCHILFVGGNDAQTLTAVRGSPVLTVTDNRDAGAAGIINFVVKDNHVRFTIDDASAAQNNLVISSKLLSLALDVKLRSSAAPSVSNQGGSH